MDKQDRITKLEFVCKRGRGPDRTCLLKVHREGVKDPRRFWFGKATQGQALPELVSEGAQSSWQVYVFLMLLATHRSRGTHIGPDDLLRPGDGEDKNIKGWHRYTTVESIASRLRRLVPVSSHGDAVETDGKTYWIPDTIDEICIEPKAELDDILRWARIRPGDSDQQTAPGDPVTGDASERASASRSGTDSEKEDSPPSPPDTQVADGARPGKTDTSASSGAAARAVAADAAAVAPSAPNAPSATVDSSELPRPIAPTPSHPNATATLAPEELPIIRKPLRVWVRRGFVFAAFLAALIATVLIIHTWYFSPPCLPMTAHCLIYRSPVFQRSEFGILVEQKSFSNDDDARHATEVLADRLEKWRNEILGEITANRPACKFWLPPVRLIVVSEVTPDLVKASGAALGFSGRFDLRGTVEDRDFYLVEGTGQVNVRGLSSFTRPPPHISMKQALPRNQRIVSPLSRGIVTNYYERETTFVPDLLAAMFDEPVAPVFKGEFGFHYRPHPDLTLYRGATPYHLQKLDFSISSEFSLLTVPGAADQPVDLVVPMLIRSSDLVDYVKPLLRLRTLLDGVLGQCVAVDSSTTISFYYALFGPVVGYETLDLAEYWPAPIRGVTYQVLADLNLALGPPESQRVPEEREVSPELGTRWSTTTWPYQVHELYRRAAETGINSCVNCYPNMARLMYYVDDYGRAVLDLIGHAGTLPDRTREQRFRKGRWLNLAYKYQVASISRSSGHYQDVRDYALQLLDNASHDGFEPMASFERTRWFLFLSGGSSAGFYADYENALAAIEAVLSLKPRHALSRYLKTKILFRLDGLSQSRDAVLILRDLLRELVEANGTYEEDLHSLGPGDDVYHSVDATLVLEDAVAAAFSQCDEHQLAELLAIAEHSSLIDWARIESLIHQPNPVFFYFMFPAWQQSFQPQNDYLETCPDIAHLVSILSRQIQAVKGLAK